MNVRWKGMAYSTRIGSDTSKNNFSKILDRIYQNCTLAYYLAVEWYFAYHVKGIDVLYKKIVISKKKNVLKSLKRIFEKDSFLLIPPLLIVKCQLSYSVKALSILYMLFGFRTSLVFKLLGRTNFFQQLAILKYYW